MKAIEVPPAFAASTVAREGAAGEAWLRDLPGRVRDLCADWDLRPAGPVRHGYVGIVVPVVRDGRRFALKVSWIDPFTEQEAMALRAWGGRGAVHLLEAREADGAMLLEWANPNRTLESLPPDEAAGIGGRLLRRLAVAPPPGLRTVREEVAGFATSARAEWDRLGRPFPSRLLDRALELAGVVSSTGTSALVNQDLHYGNVLEGRREPWLVIDPKPLAGALEFGVAPLLWTRFEALGSRADARRRMAIVSDAAETDPSLALEMTILRTVDYWLWALGEGLTGDPERCATLIEWLAPRLAR